MSTFFARTAGVAKRLSPFQPASLERDIEQTLCLLRRYRKERERAEGKVSVSST
jgi:hypothetical protein